MATAHEWARGAVEQLQREGVVELTDAQAARLCYVLTEVISDALREQVEWARAQVPVTKIEIR